MKLTPILTEKSLKDAKSGFYTFWVLPSFRKDEIRNSIEKSFDVHVTAIRTINYKATKRRNFKGHTVKTNAFKKAIVKLLDKEKIDIFKGEVK